MNPQCGAPDDLGPPQYEQAPTYRCGAATCLFLSFLSKGNMKPFLLKVVGIKVIGLVLVCMALPVASAGTPNAAPFGLEIGVASCAAAREKLGRVEERQLGGTDVLLTVAAPAALYEGATEVVVRCSDNIVIAVQIEASKGGMGNAGSRAAYANLSKKYQRVAGGDMPELGSGYARFAAGNAMIEQDAPHMRFEFTVTYYKKSFYDCIVASRREKDKQSRDKQASAL